MSAEIRKAAANFFCIARRAVFQKTIRLSVAHEICGVAAVLALTVIGASCSRAAPTVCIATTSEEQVCVGVEIARTPEERRMGLMFRKSLPENRGMLFIADSDGVQSFTMHNTLIPLDLLFIGGDLRVAGMVENARPLTEGPYRCDRPSRYVLEVNAGFCKRHGIALGDRVVFSGGIRQTDDRR